eukprot:Clim_evm126s157 gene=Clim_evmTU126s157
MADNSNDVTYNVTPEGVAWIRFNRPKVGNAMNSNSYRLTTDYVLAAESDPNVKIIVITGEGRFYSSGADVAQASTSQQRFLQPRPEDDYVGRAESFRNTRTDLDGGPSGLTRVLYNAKKLLICGLNGPAVGIAAAQLGAFDMVYAAESSSLYCPFMTLAICPEGGSAFTFPFSMGRSLANDILLGGRTVTARELERVGFVAKVYPNATFREDLEKRVSELAEFWSAPLQVGKDLISSDYRRQSLMTNDIEQTTIAHRFESGDPAKAFMMMAQRLSEKRKARM